MENVKHKKVTNLLPS